MGMLYAAIDIHKQVLQAAVLDPASGELRDARFPATREALREWANASPGAGRRGGDRSDVGLALDLA
jgi:hypothetical protein